MASAMEGVGLVHARGKAPVIALEVTLVSVQETEAMTLSLEPRRQKPEKRIYRICYFSKSRFPFFFLAFLCFLLLPPSLYSMAYEQFLPLPLSISFERNFKQRLITA